MVSANLLESRADIVRTEVMCNYDLTFKEQKVDRKLKVVALGGDALHTLFTEKKEKKEGGKEEVKDYWTYKVIRKIGEGADDAVKGD